MQLNLSFSLATEADAAAIAAIQTAAAEDLTRRFGQGPWSSATSERGVLVHLRRPHSFSKTLLGRTGSAVAGTLRLATKKPWAIDTAYFTSVPRPLYLVGMAVHPDFQGKGVGRRLLKEAEAIARAWPGDAIRLDAWDADAGAGGFYAKCGYRDVGHVSYKGVPHIYFELLL